MKFFLLAAMLLLTEIVSSQSSPSDLKPVLAAIQVENLDSSIYFYSTFLGFRVKERKSFPDYNLEIAFIQNNGFELELVKNDKSLKKNKILNENKAADITGFAKLSFEVSNISRLYDHLKAEQVKIVVTLRESNREKNYLTFIITDPENNWIQFIGKK
jgi:catechol 2,3-dioxygenase-like lactoylglutathione lyase family enzyme